MKRSHRWMAVALYWRAAWQDSNPDIGMGPFLSSLLERLLADNGNPSVTFDEQAAIVDRVARQRKKENGR